MNVKIRVKTTITNDGDQDTFELATFGRYYDKGPSVFLQYEEHMDPGIIKTIVKVTDNETTISRSGAVNMKMVFQTHNKLPGKYDTPIGSMSIMTLTNKRDYSYEEDIKKGLVMINYDLEMQGAHAGTYHMEISFEEENK